MQLDKNTSYTNIKNNAKKVWELIKFYFSQIDYIFHNFWFGSFKNYLLYSTMNLSLYKNAFGFAKKVSSF